MEKFHMMIMILIMQILCPSWATPMAEAEAQAEAEADPDVSIQIQQIVGAGASGHAVENPLETIEEEEEEDTDEDLDTCSGWHYPGYDWSTTCPNFCSGNRQSPIDFDMSGMMNGLESFIMKDEQYTYTNFDQNVSSINIANDGNTVILTIDPSGKTPTVSGGGLGAHYTMSHLQFHWGCDEWKGTEHLFNGENGNTLEIHFFFYKTSSGSFEAAMEHSDGIVAISQGAKVEGTVLNPVMTLITDNLSSITEPGTFVDIPFNGNFEGFGNFQKNLRYHGSLTTPPCNEVVTWLVLAHDMRLPQSQMDAFLSLKDFNGAPLCDNIREVQPNNGRNITVMNFI